MQVKVPEADPGEDLHEEEGREVEEGGTGLSRLYLRLSPSLRRRRRGRRRRRRRRGRSLGMRRRYR
jgi:hypothetical protein